MNQPTTRPQRIPITCTSPKYDPTLGQKIMEKYGLQPAQVAYNERQKTNAELRERLIKIGKLGRGISNLPESQLCQDPDAKRQREYRRRKQTYLLVNK